MRLLCSICLCCAIFFSFNIQPAKAEINFSLPSIQPIRINPDFISDPVRDVRDGLNYLVESGMAESTIQSISDGFVSGFGQVGGGIAGATAACYVTNALILPLAPPVAGALTTYCPCIGGVAGSFGGAVASKTAEKQATNIFRTLAPKTNHQLIPALF